MEPAPLLLSRAEITALSLLTKAADLMLDKSTSFHPRPTQLVRHNGGDNIEHPITTCIRVRIEMILSQYGIDSTHNLVVVRMVNYNKS